MFEYNIYSIFLIFYNYLFLENISDEEKIELVRSARQHFTSMLLMLQLSSTQSKEGTSTANPYGARTFSLSSAESPTSSASAAFPLSIRTSSIAPPFQLSNSSSFSPLPTNTFASSSLLINPATTTPAKKKLRSPPIDSCTKLSPLTHHIHRDEQEGFFWECSLNQTNIGFNNNKFYLIQLIVSENAKDMYLLSRWGRVGESGQYKLEKFDGQVWTIVRAGLCTCR